MYFSLLKWPPMCVCLLSRERKVYVPELRAQPAEVGKIGLYQALGRAFKHVFSNPEDANHNGPEYGKVVQEGGHLTAQSDHEKIRTCMALRLLLVIISGKLSKFTSPSTRRSRPPFLDFLVFWLWVSYIGSMQLVCT